MTHKFNLPGLAFALNVVCEAALIHMQLHQIGRWEDGDGRLHDTLSGRGLQCAGSWTSASTLPVCVGLGFHFLLT